MERVLYVTTTFPTLAAFIENEVKRLDARGVTVRVLTLRHRGRRFQPEHAPLLALTDELGVPWSPRQVVSLLRWLVRRPHVLVPIAARMIVQSLGSPYALAGHLAYLPAAARVADIVEQGDFEVVHGAWAHFPASVAYLAARLTDRPFTMSGHAGSDLHRTRAFLAEKVAAAAFVTCCVRANAVMLRELVPGARVHELHHGTDLARFGAIERHPAQEPTLLVVGRLAPAKGFDDAILALGRLRERGLAARLVVVGEGPERGRLEALAAAHGVADRIDWRGALDHDQLAPCYASAWMLLAPSKVLANGRRDGIPNVVIEAMAAGLPVAGSRATGIDEAVRDGENGVLCEPGDPQGLAAAIEPLLRDPERLTRMGLEARRTVGEAFDVERAFARLWALFEGVR